MEKKLIAFDDELFERIVDFSKRYKKSFTEAVRVLLQLGLKTHYNGDEILTDSLDLKVQKLESNLEMSQAEIEKKINVITAALKLFKGHIKDHSIHLQD